MILLLLYDVLYIGCVRHHHWRFLQYVYGLLYAHALVNGDGADLCASQSR